MVLFGPAGFNAAAMHRAQFVLFSIMAHTFHRMVCCFQAIDSKYDLLWFMIHDKFWARVSEPVFSLQFLILRRCFHMVWLDCLTVELHFSRRGNWPLTSVLWTCAVWMCSPGGSGDTCRCWVSLRYCYSQSCINIIICLVVVILEFLQARASW